MELGADGTLWNPQRITSIEKARVLRDSLECDWDESQALASQVSTLRELKAFCKTEEILWIDPDVLTLKLFLNSYHNRGPTVP